MRRWMLHGNVSRKGYGNALMGRYGGYFEERYKEAYDDRAYHAKGLDAPARYAPTLEVRKVNAQWYDEEDSSLTPRWLPQVEGEM